MTLLIFVYGLIIGSFLNVCIYRIPRKESIVLPSSHCINCSISIKWYDNIPVFSYVILKGKCRYCKEKIPIQYPIIELLNGIIYLLLFNKFDLSVDFIFYGLISSILIVVAIIDLKEMIIPDSLLAIVLILSILSKLTSYYRNQISINLLDSLGAVILAGGFFLIIIILSHGGMGEGDVTLISTLGFLLGIRLILLNIFLSFILGGVISVFLLLRKIKSKHDPIPFGPFIIVGFMMTLFWGEGLIDWYINNFIIRIR